MKTIITIKESLLALAIVSALMITGCNDQFLEEKKDYSGAADEVYNMFATAQGKVDYIYNLCLPNSTANEGHSNPSTGRNDAHGASTEEFGGSTIYVGTSEMSNINVEKLFANSATDGPWTRIRECNNALEGIDKGTLTESEKNELKGQVYFWRAWVYTRLAITYGGVPIVVSTQNPVLGDNPDQSDLKVQRSTTQQTIDFICEDLDKAVSLLPNSWPAASEGRVIKAAAAALKARLLLFYASPLFNPTDDQTRWNTAYEASKAAYTIATQSNKALVQSTAATNAKVWGEMFTSYNSPEGILVKQYNSKTDDQMRLNNNWEQSVRPATDVVLGGQSLMATAEMVDLFPMADGSKPVVGVNYDKKLFFKNRDPRFYRTFAFTGSVWPYDGNASFTVWNYSWYNSAANYSNVRNLGFSATLKTLGSTYSGVYIRKRSSSTAKYDASQSGGAFILSAVPYFEIRMGEVVLNFAEAACGANKLDEAYDYLKSIRARAYGAASPAAANDFGLLPVKGDRQQLFSAILYERQIELAYEGKRFQDMRRWLLWDGGATLNTITGKALAFGGNTCTYLGVAPLNGQRRHGILMVNPTVSSSYNQSNDPLKTQQVGVGLNPDANAATFATQVTALETFYSKLVRKDIDNVDGTDVNFKVTFRPKYYFPAIHKDELKQNPYIWQQLGWKDYYEVDGTYNPLLETLPN